jgi:hypothetical protein
MPKGPQGQKWPTDANQLAKRIVDIATGEADEDQLREKNKSAVELGRAGGTKGGKARARSPQDRRRKRRPLSGAGLRTVRGIAVTPCDGRL